MMLKVMQCFTDHITVMVEGVQDGSWVGLGGVRRSVKGIKLGRVWECVCTFALKSREGCGWR